jgi:hypothetical protein
MNAKWRWILTDQAMQILLYLIETGKLTADQFVAVCSAQAKRQETIGSIALRTHILSTRQVEQILRVQSLEDASFGEIAVRLGLLSRQKLTSLLRLQQDYRPRLQDLAVEFGYLCSDDLNDARSSLRRTHRERELELLSDSNARCPGIDRHEIDAALGPDELVSPLTVWQKSPRIDESRSENSQ